MIIAAKLIDDFLNSPCDILGWEKSSWREWFADVLITICTEGEGFSGKRPNCDSGWERNLAEGLSRVEPKIVIKWEEEHTAEGHYRYAGEIDWQLMTKVVKRVVEYLCCIA